MGLIQCPDCQGKVSTEAASCPHCGRPVSSRTPEPTQQAEPDRSPVRLQHEAEFVIGTRRFNGLAVAALALCCAAFFTGPLTALPGVICGHVAIRQCRENPALAGRGMAIAALIIGYLALSVVIVIALVLIGIFSSV